MWVSRIRSACGHCWEPRSLSMLPTLPSLPCTTPSKPHYRCALSLSLILVTSISWLMQCIYIPFHGVFISGRTSSVLPLSLPSVTMCVCLASWVWCMYRRHLRTATLAHNRAKHICMCIHAESSCSVRLLVLVPASSWQQPCFLATRVCIQHRNILGTMSVQWHLYEDTPFPTPSTTLACIPPLK